MSTVAPGVGQGIVLVEGLLTRGRNEAVNQVDGDSFVTSARLDAGLFDPNSSQVLWVTSWSASWWYADLNDAALVMRAVVTDLATARAETRYRNPRRQRAPHTGGADTPLE